VVELYLAKWGCVFRQIRGCNADIKKQLEEILTTHKMERELIDLEWLFYVRNIFVLFRVTHDLVRELGMIEAVFEGRPVNIPEPLELNTRPPRLPQAPIGTPRQVMAPAPLHMMSPMRGPFFMAPYPIFHSTPSPAKSFFEAHTPIQLETRSTISMPSPTPISPQFSQHQQQIQKPPPPAPAQRKSSPPRQVKSKANINPMDMINVNDVSPVAAFSRSSSIRSSSKKQSRSKRPKEPKKEPIKDEPINPGLLARITSDD